MLSTGLRRPPAPTCEDCVDEDTLGVFTDSRAPANVSVKRTKSSEFDTKSVGDKKSNDGSDSGYSSKAGTSDIMPSATPKKGTDLKIKTKPSEFERERQPYTYAPPTRSEEPRSSPTKAKAVKPDKMSKQPQPFQHPPVPYWGYDAHGYHFDPEREIARPATVAPQERSPAPRSRKEASEMRPPTSRRSSSTARQARPMSMYAGYGPPYQMDFQPQMFGQSGWPPQHPLPPPQQNDMQQFAHYQQYGYFPPTPVSGSFAQHLSPFDMSPLHNALPHEMYHGQPPYNGYDEPVRTSKSSKHDSGIQRTASRHRSNTKSKKEAEKAANDRDLMPPPPPKMERVRPSMHKVHTDHVYASSGRRRSVFEEDDDDRAEFRAAMLVKDRTSSQSRPHSRPPSSYKTLHKSPPGAEILNQPKARKSSSYETPSGTVHVASTQRDVLRRRTDPTEQRIADAEEYVKKTKKTTTPPIEFDDDEEEEEEVVSKYKKETISASLTPEALRKLETRTSAVASDAGSVRSKRSSGESAAGRTRAGTTLTNSAVANITLDNGVSFSIPTDCDDHVNIQVGNFRVSMTPMGYDEELRPRELKRIERAPSEASHASRKSLTNSSALSASRTKEEQPRYKSGANSKRSSRAASTSRTEKNRGSIDYSVMDPESYYTSFDYGM